MRLLASAHPKIPSPLAYFAEVATKAERERVGVRVRLSDSGPPHLISPPDRGRGDAICGWKLVKGVGKSFFFAWAILALSFSLWISQARSDEPPAKVKLEGTVLDTGAIGFWDFTVQIDNFIEGPSDPPNPIHVVMMVSPDCHGYIDTSIDVEAKVWVYGDHEPSFGGSNYRVNLCEAGSYIRNVSCCACDIWTDKSGYFEGDNIDITLNFCSESFTIIGLLPKAQPFHAALIEGCNVGCYGTEYWVTIPELRSEVRSYMTPDPEQPDFIKLTGVVLEGGTTIIGYHSIESVGGCSPCTTREPCDPDAFSVTVQDDLQENTQVYTQADFQRSWEGQYTSKQETVITAGHPGNWEVSIESPGCAEETINFVVANPGEVIDCMEISLPGTYTLKNDIDDSPHAGCCIEITTSDVTFNGNGKYIDGVEQDNTVGICVGDLGSDALHNVTIKNISRVSDWETGIRFQNVVGGGEGDAIPSRIEDSQIWSNDVGIGLVASSQVIVTGNDVRSNNDYGILLSGSDGNDITNNTVESNFDGIFLIDSDDNTIMGNTSQANWSNIGFSASSNNVIAENVASGGAFGIDLYANSNSNTITENTVQNNLNDGIHMDDQSSNNTVSQNLVCYNNRSEGSYHDIYDGDSNSGDENICDSTDGWIDATAAENCRFECHDRDGDGIDNDADNCPDVHNPEQTNSDTDPLGDACDKDADNDGVPDKDDKLKPLPPSEGGDNCPLVKNADQSDMDNDDVGDACDDSDDDGIVDADDNCPFIQNPGQEDADGDETGDVCDECTDTDDDGYGDPGFSANTCDTDNCPDDPNADQADTDSDGLGNVCDNCPNDVNPDQADWDGDGEGDVCDDSDGDGVDDAEDNCPQDDNADQNDMDSDGEGDVCDSDRDGDGKANDQDNCPDHDNACQSDTDGDGLGDACDPLVEMSPNPNPADSSIMAGGTVYRYYKVVDECGAPWSGVTATLEYGEEEVEVGPSDTGGILAVGVAADDLGSPDETVACSITEVDDEPITPVDFNVKIKHREYEKTWEGGLSVSGSGRATIKGVNASAGGGLSLKLKDRDPSDVSSDDTISIGRKYSAEAGASIGSSTGASATIGPATAGAELSAEVGLSLIALLGDSYEFTDPYGEEALIAETGLLLATFYDMANKLTNPVMSQVINWIMGWVSNYNAYLKEQVGEMGLKIQAGSSAVAGLGTGFESTDEGDSDLLPFVGIGFGADISGSVAGYVTGGAKYNEDLDGDGQPDGDTIIVGTRLEGQLDTSTYVGIVAAEGDEMEKVIGDVFKDGEAGSVAFQIIYTDAGVLHGVEIKYCETKNYGFGVETDGISPTATSGATTCGSIKYGSGEAQQVIDELAGIALSGIGSLVFGPSVFLGALEDLALNAGTLPGDYEIVVKDGDGFAFPVNFTVGVSGVGDVGLGFEIKLDRTIEYEEHLGVLRNGKHYTLEDYSLVAWPTVDEGTGLSQIADAGLKKVFEKAPSLVQAVQDVINEAGEAVLEAADKTADFFIDLGEGAGGTVIQCLSTASDWWPWQVKGDFVVQQEGAGEDALLGITGYHMLTPEGTVMAEPRSLTLYYGDEDLNGYDEGQLSIYAWDLETQQWVRLDSLVDDVNNTVTSEFQVFTTFALGLPFPSGDIDLIPSQSPAEPEQTVQFTSAVISLSNGDPVPDGTLLSLSAIKGATFGMEDFGTIEANDEDDKLEGIQVGTSNGTVSFSYLSPDEYGIARIVAESVQGGARGEYRLNVVQSSSPGDSDRDTTVNLGDAILSQQVCCGMTPTFWVDKGSDVNGDEKVGPHETLYILQRVAEIRN